MTRPATSSPSHEGQAFGSNVILYLPPGPLFRVPGVAPIASNEEPDAKPLSDSDKQSDSRQLLQSSPQHILASVTSAIVVTVNYRLGIMTMMDDIGSENMSASVTKSHCRESTKMFDPAEFHRYPTPVHDTLAGFDWILTHLRPARLGIYGQHIGGSLALMLALTESQNVGAVAAMEPVCDWSGLDDYCTLAETANPKGAVSQKQKRNPRRSSRSLTPPDLMPLLKAREQFFTSPERCFDAFASPILFLRSAGRDVPRTFPQYLPGSDNLAPISRDTGEVKSAEQQAAPSGSTWDRDVHPDFDVDADVDSDATTTEPRRRKALSRWPPYGLDYGSHGQTKSGSGPAVRRLQVTLPWVRVFLQNKQARLPSSSIQASTQLTDGRRVPKTSRTVLDNQGEEIVSVMRRACFFGHEKGFGERRVSLSLIDRTPEEYVGDWLNGMFEETLDREVD